MLLVLWCLVYLWVYLPFIFLLTPYQSIIIFVNLALVLLLICAIAFIIRAISLEFKVNKLSLLGLELRNASDSIYPLMLFGFLKIVSIFTAIYYHAVGGMPNWLFYFPRPIIPFVAIIRWLLSGTLTFSVLMAFSIEVLDLYSKLNKRNILLVFLGLCAVYNAPLSYFLYGELITVSFLGELIDIVMLGIGLLLYLKLRNAIGIILVYTFIYEGPVNQAILYGWGLTAYIIYALIWIALATISLVLLLKKRLTPSKNS